MLSYLKLAIINIGGLLVTPYIIKMLGDEEYGLYTLIGAFVGYLSILDLGLNNAIVRYVAQYRAEKNQKAEENFLAISLLIYISVGILLVILGSIFYFNVEVLFGDTLDAAQLDKARLMLLVLIINIGFTLPGGAFTGICTGYEAFVFPRWLSIIKYVMRVILIVAILNLGADALGIVILDTLLNLALIIVTVWFVFYKLRVRIKLHQFELTFVREIFGYSIWIFIFGLVYQFQWRTGQVILGTHLSTVTVAIYGIGVMLGIYFTTFGNIINQLILPRAVKSVYYNSSSEKITNECIQVGRVSLVVMLYAYGAFFILGESFIINWIGETYKNSYWIALLIMTTYILHLSQGYLHAILDAKKILKFKTLSFLIASVLGTIIGGLLSYRYGELGMITGVSFALCILYWIVMNIYYYNILKIDIKKVLFKFSTYFIIAIVVIIISIIIMMNISISEDWGGLIVKGVIYSTIFVLLMSIKKSNRLLIKKIIER